MRGDFLLVVMPVETLPFSPGIIEESEGEREKRDELLFNIIVPKEIFKTETGELRAWISKHYVPVETTVKDYILLGDLHAKFTRREVHH